MIRFTEHGDVVMAKRFKALDPFQLAAPCYVIPVLPQLPELLPNMRPTHEQIEQRDKERLMAVKFVTEQEAPQRLHGRGVISASQEYIDALNAIRAIPPGKAILVTLESPEVLKKTKPEVTFAYSIRRYLASNGIMATAYQSGPKEVVIRRSAAPPTAKKRTKK